MKEREGGEMVGKGRARKEGGRQAEGKGGKGGQWNGEGLNGIPYFEASMLTTLLLVLVSK